MKKISVYIPWALAALGTAVYVSLIFNNNLWMDEAFTAVLVRGSFSSMIHASMADTLPPLYNILLWFMTHLFGYDSVIMKLTSVIPMILLLLSGCTAVRRNFGLQSSILFMLCVIAAPNMLHYGVEIRMYSLALLFGTLSGIYAYEAYKTMTRRSWIMLIISTVAAGYTHQFALITSAFVWLFLLIMLFISKKRVYSKWFISLGTVIISYIPCLIVTITQLKNASSYFSASGISLSGFLSCLRYPFVTNITPVSFILLSVFILGVLYSSRRVVSYLYIAVYPMVLVFSYIIMLVSGSTFFSSRYLVPSLGLLWLGFSILVGQSERRYSRYMTIFSILTLISAGAVLYHSQFLLEYSSGVSHMTDYFSANLKSDDGYIIYENNYQIELCMRYYEPGFKKYDMDHADDIKGNIWYFEVPGYENKLDETADYGYNKVYIGDMSFDIYSFKLYKLIKQ